MDRCKDCGRALKQSEFLWCEPCIQQEEDEDEAQAMQVIVHCAACGIKDSEPVMSTCDDCRVYLCITCSMAHECEEATA